MLYYAIVVENPEPIPIPPLTNIIGIHGLYVNGT